MSDEIARLRQSAVRLEWAARSFANAAEERAWALWATGPEMRNAERFNHAYAAKRLAETGPKYGEALAELRAALEEEADHLG